MKILMSSAEGPPLQRAGALVDVMDALPSALRARGHEVSVVLPFYREIKENRAFKKKKNTGMTVDVQVFFFSSTRRHTRCRLVTEFRRVLFRSPILKAARWRSGCSPATPPTRPRSS